MGARETLPGEVLREAISVLGGLAADLRALRAERDEALEVLSMSLAALGSHARGFSQEALVRACVLVGSDPEDWTQYPDEMRARRDLLPAAPPASPR